MSVGREGAVFGSFSKKEHNIYFKNEKVIF